MNLGRCAGSVAILVALAGCARIDPLAVIDQPGGEHQYHHYLVGEDTQIVCILDETENRCNLDRAELVVTSIDLPDALNLEWVGGDTLAVSMPDGQVERAEKTSRNGRIQIDLMRD